MNAAKRVTFTIPDYVYRQLLVQTQPGQVSQFVAEAVREKIADIKINSNPIDEFLNLSGVLPKMSMKQIKAVINKGRA